MHSVDPRWRFLASFVSLARRITVPGRTENPKERDSYILPMALDVTAASEVGRG